MTESLTMPFARIPLRHHAVIRHLLLASLISSWLVLAGCSSSSSSLSSISVYGHDRHAIIAGVRQAHREWSGTPYQLGGNTKSGIDCSSLVQQTYRNQFGVSLPRTTKAQITAGIHVNRSELQPGDLVFFQTGANQRHVGIYLDKGEFLNASTSKGVIISRLDNPYWSKHYWRSRRIL